MILSTMASAAQSPARVVGFTYVRSATATDCPDEETIRGGVAARLGYEPFQRGAAGRISARVTRNGRILEARIQVIDARGRITAERKLTSHRNDCIELTSAVELAISIAIDPLAGGRPAPAPEERVAAPPPAPPVVVHRPSPAPPAQAPEAPATPRTPIAAGASVGAVGAVGSAPAAALGATVQAFLRRGRLSMGLEARADFPVTAPLRIGQVRTSLLTGSLVPCWHARIFAACLLAAGGATRASGHELDDARHVTIPYAALGGRVSFEVPATGALLIRVHGDIIAPLTETVLRVSGAAVWTSPPVSAALGLAVGTRFL